LRKAADTTLDIGEKTVKLSTAAKIITSKDEGFSASAATQEDIDAVKAQSDDAIFDTLASKPETKVEKNVQAEVVSNRTREQIEADRQLKEDAKVKELQKQGRIKKVEGELKNVDKQLNALDKEFIKQDDVNKRTAALKDDLKSLNNERKINAAQIEQLNKDLRAQQRAGKDTTNITKTLDKIGEKQQIVVNKIEQRQKELSKLNARSTKALEAKADKLYAQRKELDDELLLLRANLFENEDFKGLDVTVKADKIQRLREKQVAENLKKFEQGIRKGTVLAKQDIKDVQNQVISVLKESELTTADKGKFITAVKNIQTQAQLEKALPVLRKRIGELQNRNELKRVDRRFKRLTKRAKLRKTSSKRPVGKFATGDDRGADVQKVLDTYINALNDPIATSQRLQDLNLKEDLSVEENVERRILSAVANVPYQVKTYEREGKKFAKVEFTDPKAANKLADEIDAVIDKGRSDALAWAEKRQQEKLNNRTVARRSTVGKVPATGQEIDSFKDRFIKKYRTIGITVTPFDQLMRVISQHDAKHELQDLLDTNSAMAEELNLAHRWNQRMATLASESFPSLKNQPSKLLKRLKDDDKVNIKLSWVDPDGKQRDENLSRAQARKLWMEMQDPSLRESFEEAEGKTFDGPDSTLEALERVLDDEDITFARNQLEFYREFYDEVANPLWRRRNGVDLPFNNFYSPIKRKGVDIAPHQEFLGEVGLRSTLKPTSSKSRLAGVVTDMTRQSDYEVMMAHVSDWTRFSAWADTLQKIDDVLSDTGSIKDPGFTRLVEQKYGKKVLPVMRQLRQNFIENRRQARSLAEDYFKTIRGNFASALVGSKPDQLLKQYSSVVTALDVVSVDELITAHFDAIKNPKQVSAVLSESPLFRNRGKNFQDDVKAAMESSEGVQFLEVPTFQNANMWFTKFADKLPGFTGGWAVYKKTLKDTGSKEKALREFDRFMETSQQSANLNQLSALETSSPFVKLGLLFSKSPMQYSLKILHSFIDMANGNIKPQEFARTFAVYHVIAPFMFTLASNAVPAAFGLRTAEEVEENLMWSLVFGPWSMLYVWGDLLGDTAKAIHNITFDKKTKTYKPEFIFTDAMGGVIDGLNKVNKILHPSDGSEVTMKDYFQAMRYFADAAPLIPKKEVGGIPYGTYVNWMESIYNHVVDGAPVEETIGTVLSGKKKSKAAREASVEPVNAGVFIPDDL
jgi:small nuclear ribonucleoprotein (snRNP)-like protein